MPGIICYKRLCIIHICWAIEFSPIVRTLRLIYWAVYWLFYWHVHIVVYQLKCTCILHVLPVVVLVCTYFDQLCKGLHIHTCTRQYKAGSKMVVGTAGKLGGRLFHKPVQAFSCNTVGKKESHLKSTKEELEVQVSIVLKVCESTTCLLHSNSMLHMHLWSLPVIFLP